MYDLQMTALLARYEKLDSAAQACVLGYVDDAMKRLEVALSVAERMRADGQHQPATGGQLRCVYTRPETVPTAGVS